MNSRSFRGKGKPGRPPISDLFPVSGCTLGQMRATMCTGEVCDNCGWNRDEQARRKAAMHRSGLTLDPETGLRRLTVGRRG